MERYTPRLTYEGATIITKGARWTGVKEHWSRISAGTTARMCADAKTTASRFVATARSKAARSSRSRKGGGDGRGKVDSGHVR